MYILENASVWSPSDLSAVISQVGRGAIQTNVGNLSKKSNITLSWDMRRGTPNHSEYYLVELHNICRIKNNRFAGQWLIFFLRTIERANVCTDDCKGGHVFTSWGGYEVKMTSDFLLLSW